MRTVEQSGKPAQALEITAALAGRRFGLCGFDAGEAQRISRVLGGASSLALLFDERLLGESARVCDALLIKLAGISPEGLRAAAASPAPILVAGPSEAILEGAGAAYSWPRDFMGEPWPDAELLVRLFRLLPFPGGSRAAVRESRVEPLVLLADDDPELVALVAATLRNDGIACRTADNGLAALRLARELAPDLLVLDVKMPGMDGFEVLETVRRDPGLQMLPVILLTGCDDSSDVLRGSELDADEYLGKPVSPTLLLNRVRRRLSTGARNPRRWARSLSESAASGGRLAKRWMLNGSSQPGAGEQP
ncbi:MAG: response regulator [Acidobacteriia bacterium]|nr:response regulator [Terriglobia bacterium]